jgi:AraC-like DNA-binding protein
VTAPVRRAARWSERFGQLVGQPPMHYLAGWRMQLRTRLLAEHSMKVRAIADSVGYASEPRSAARSRSTPGCRRRRGGRR